MLLNDAIFLRLFCALVSAVVEILLIVCVSDAQVIYRIKLPGYPILGEGKPENQNHAIIFTRGEGLQAIDMNQVNKSIFAFGLW